MKGATLFIASSICDTIELFKHKVKRGQVLFVANPSDPFKSKYWVNKDYNAFVKNNYEVRKLDLREINCFQLAGFLKRADILHVCGGSAMYMMKLLKDNQMDNVIVNAVRLGLIYTGTSAGSMIASPDISLCKDDADEEEAGMKGKLKDLKGLGMIPFYPSCHSQDKYYVDSSKKIMEAMPKNKVPVLFLNDNMAVWSVDSKLEIVKK